MKMRRLVHITVWVLIVAELSLSGIAQARPNQYDPPSQTDRAKPKDGFVDSTLKRINPTDIAYGKCLDEGRTILLKETVQSGYFWSNVTALGLLVFLFATVVCQRRIYKNREIRYAEVLVQYRNAMSRLNRQVDEITNQSRALKQAARIEMTVPVPGSELPSPDAAAPAASGSRTRVNREKVVAPTPPPSTSVKVPRERNSRAEVATEPLPQMALFKSDTDLVIKVNALEQQLVRSEEQQKVLRRQLNETGRQLQLEQDKNRRLKGA